MKLFSSPSLQPDSTIPDARLKVLQDPLPGSRGRVVMQHIRAGLSLKYEDLSIREASNLSVFFQPGLRLVFALEGDTRIHTSDQQILFSSASSRQAALLPMAENVLGYKRFEAPQKKRELVIFMTPQWLQESVPPDQYPHLADCFKAHLKPCYFTLTPLINRLLLRLTDEHYLQLKPLQQESFCLSLIHECLEQIRPRTPENQSGHQARLTDKIDALLQADPSLTVSAVAHYCNSSSATVQRFFRRRHGISIGDYRRHQMLEQGHQALRNGASVADAAAVAGYRHLQSFSDAFRKHFGCLPRDIKSQK